MKPHLLLLLFVGACSSAAHQETLSPQASAVSQIAIVSEKLPSGYQVVIARTPPVQGRVPRIYVGSYALHGSLQETRFGLAHLMEHVIANNRSAIAGPRAPEGVNYIDGNALTRPYYTSFVSVIPPALLPAAINTRMARLGRAQDDSAVFATQVGRVLAEVERDEGGTYPAYKAAVALALGASPRIADELNLVRNTTREELAAAMAPIYRPDNGVFVVAGDLNIDSTLALIRETEARLKLTELKGSGSREGFPTLRMNQSAVIDSQNTSNKYVVSIAWKKPPLGDPDQIPLLIADQLLLGRSEAVDDPARSDSSPVAMRLARGLSGSSFWDGRTGKWAAPDLVDTGPGVYAFVFRTDRRVTPAEVRDSVMSALRDIRSRAMTDADIGASREQLASFYERWFFEPTYRVLGDHLMAYAVTGRNPEQVKQIPSQIRRVKPDAVRNAFDRYLLNAPSNVVVLPPSKQ